MKIWEMNSHEKSRELTYGADYSGNHPFYQLANGLSVSSIWEPMKVKTYKKGKYLDFTSFGSGVMVFSNKSFECLSHLMMNDVEFLPVEYDEYEIQFGNVTKVLDCVDKQKSVPISEELFLGYKKIVFHETLIPSDTNVFIVPELTATKIFVTERIVQAVQKAKLKGFVFTEIWDSEYTEEMEQERKQRYENILSEVERNKGPEFTYDEAIEKLENSAVASGRWRMQRDERGRLWLGQLGDDCEFHWLMPTYMPPILLAQQWHVIERTVR
ncbi:hypothetical protein PaecuDRAFT_4456 [Paenibacillus curdlanolyticus YK9]|uniref:Immunity MXAN-0049 protein domain-containing protein n=1 Tax=Paenibacillus curdlanolyticus YK9 TaxID=717606 RepID=E0IFV1_9BACL|nr:DUF1629 domain-containing protein [Paenibacillus curdlanolyticus]EFM08662.1 hypothetical protein PaecuDRAFT_4456 [Paenibacillus curdlanolyticus YK9]